MEKEIKVDFKRIFREVMKKWWFIGMIAVFCFGVAFVVTDSRQVIYGGKTSVFSVAYGSYSQSVEGTKLLLAYSEIASSKRVADRAAKLLGNPDITGDNILEFTQIGASEDSAIIQIYGIHQDPNVAVGIANSMAQSFIIEAQNTFGIDSLKVLDKADSAYIHSGKGQKKFSAIAFLLGIFFPVLFIAIKVIKSDKVYYVSDAELDGKLEILGIIPEKE